MPVVATAIEYPAEMAPSMTAVRLRSAPPVNWRVRPPLPSCIPAISAESPIEPLIAPAQSISDSYSPPMLAPAQPLTKADLIVRQLLRLGSLGQNWDGSGAAQPIADSLGQAREFVRSLAPESVIPEPALHADGHAVLLFSSPTAYAELEFLGGGQIGFYVRRDGERWGDEFSLGAALPLPLSDVGFVTEPSPARAAA